MTEIFVVKRLYDIGSSKPECTVELFLTESEARKTIPFDAKALYPEPGEPNFDWYLGDDDCPEEYISLETAILPPGLPLVPSV